MIATARPVSVRQIWNSSRRPTIWLPFLYYTEKYPRTRVLDKKSHKLLVNILKRPSLLMTITGNPRKWNKQSKKHWFYKKKEKISTINPRHAIDPLGMSSGEVFEESRPVYRGPGGGGGLRCRKRWPQADPAHQVPQGGAGGELGRVGDHMELRNWQCCCCHL